MSKYKLQFKLKQHTPIIHFQHNQHGATLRATELKPKLDRFLIEKLNLTEFKTIKGKEKEVPKEDYKKWFINQGKEHLALDYKVKINTTSTEIINTKIGSGRNDAYATFFANMGGDYDDNPKSHSIANGIIEIEITCFITDLKNKIETNFKEFIFNTNFGTRQNKGFGSFYMADDNVNMQNIPYLSVPVNKDIKIIFEIINYYYQRLKSGINYNHHNNRTNKSHIHYQHSFLKKYVSTKQYNWEKRWLKEKFIGLQPVDVEEKYARALLGVVDSYTFKPKNNNKREGEVYPKTEIKINVSSNYVERFKSPITFKPIKLKNEWRIYIITHKIPDEIYDKEFEFTSGNITETLKTPLIKLDVQDLIKEYNKELTSSFDVHNFTRKICTVKILK